MVYSVQKGDPKFSFFFAKKDESGAVPPQIVFSPKFMKKFVLTAKSSKFFKPFKSYDILKEKIEWKWSPSCTHVMRCSHTCSKEKMRNLFDVNEYR